MGNNPSRFKGDDLPVEQVSWDDVPEFIRKLNEKEGTDCRLSSEAEWEYACRAGTTTRYSSAILKRNSAIMRGILKTRAVRPIRSVRGSPILMDCMTCTATSGNGHRIAGIAATAARQPTAARGRMEVAPTGSSEAVAGATPPGAAGLRFVAATPGGVATAASAFAF